MIRPPRILCLLVVVFNILGCAHSLVGKYLYGESSEIVLEQTTKNDFQSNTEKARLVEFYSPYCGACQNFKTKYIEIAEELQRIGKDEVEVYAVSCTSNKELCNSINIKGYPTLMAFPAGKTEGIHLHKSEMGGEFSAVEIAKLLKVTMKSGGAPVPAFDTDIKDMTYLGNRKKTSQTRRRISTEEDKEDEDEDEEEDKDDEDKDDEEEDLDEDEDKDDEDEDKDDEDEDKEDEDEDKEEEDVDKEDEDEDNEVEDEDKKDEDEDKDDEDEEKEDVDEEKEDEDEEKEDEDEEKLDVDKEKENEEKENEEKGLYSNEDEEMDDKKKNNVNKVYHGNNNKVRSSKAMDFPDTAFQTKPDIRTKQGIKYPSGRTKTTDKILGHSNKPPTFPGSFGERAGGSRARISESLGKPDRILAGSEKGVIFPSNVGEPSEGLKASIPRSSGERAGGSKARITGSLGERAEGSKPRMPGSLGERAEGSKPRMPGSLGERAESSRPRMPGSLGERAESSRPRMPGSLGKGAEGYKQTITGGWGEQGERPGAVKALNKMRNMDKWKDILEKRKKHLEELKNKPKWNSPSVMRNKSRHTAGPGAKVKLDSPALKGTTKVMRANTPGTSEFLSRKKEMLERIAKAKRNSGIRSVKNGRVFNGRGEYMPGRDINQSDLVHKSKLPFKREAKRPNIIRKQLEKVPLVKRMFKMSAEEELIHDATLSFVKGLENEIFMSSDRLTEKKKDALKSYLELLSVSLPPEWGLHILIDDLINRIDFVSKNIINLRAILRKHPPARNVWSPSCARSKNPFSCGLWKLLHITTLGVAEHKGGLNLIESGLADPSTRTFNPAEAAEVFRGYIHNFLGCDECRKHFLDKYDSCDFRRCDRLADDNHEDVSADDWKQLALWFWEVHNDVNVHVAAKKANFLQNSLNRKKFGDQNNYVVTQDREDEISVLFPSIEDCLVCFNDEGEWHENSVFEYLERTYWDTPDSKYDRLLTLRKIDDGEDASGGGIIWYLLLIAIGIVFVLRNHVKNHSFHGRIRKLYSVMGIKQTIGDAVTGKKRTE